MDTNPTEGNQSPPILATARGLPPETREVVIKLKGEGLTNRQIVKETGVSLGSVSNITRHQAQDKGRTIAHKRKRKRGFHVEPSKKRTAKSKGTHTIAKRYKLPGAIVTRLKKEAPQHGSIGRALQLATDLLVRLNKPLKIEMPEGAGAAVVGQTYKITPRTAALIDRLSVQYGTRGAVLAACARILAAGENMKLRILESGE